MKLFPSHAPFIFFALALLSASAISAATHLEQVQAPAVYPRNTYTASYVWTQTTVDERTNTSQSSTHCTLVSSDGKGHLACESPGLMEGIQILDLPAGKLYHKSKYPEYTRKNSITSYSSFSYLNEVMFTHDSDVFDNPNPSLFGPAPIAIGPKSINGYQCEGWRRTSDYKIEEWWFDMQSKCLVLMECKPNPIPPKNQALNWLITLLMGITPKVQTITEKLDNLKVTDFPPSYFDTKNLTPISLIVSKLVETKSTPNVKPEPDIDLDRVYRESPPPSEVVKLPPPEPGWKRVTWNATKPYDLDFFFWKNKHFGREFNYTLDLPDDWSLDYGEGTTLIFGNPKKGAEIILNYWGTSAYRKCHHWYHPDASEDEDPRMLFHGFAWTDARQEVEYQMKKYCKTIQSYSTHKLLSTKITLQTTRGGISFLRADAQIRVNNAVFNGVLDHCIMLSDEGINLSFDAIPTTEKIVESLCRKMNFLLW